jgi:serine/threonine protein kinase
MLSGGKLFDEGMYGCIFTPALSCKDKSKNPSISGTEENEIILSKLILKSGADYEWNIMKKIKKIPLWKNYFVASEYSPCIPDSIQKDKDINNCKVLDDSRFTLSDFRIINLPYAGTPLSSYRINFNKFNFLDFIIHFIEAGALLNLFGIVHRDIHQSNILIDNEQVPRIIDYNLSILVENEININMLKHQYEFNLAQEPPDSTLVNSIYLGYKYDKVIDSIVNKKFIMKKIRNILNISEEEQKESLEEFYLESKSVKKGDEVGWFNNYWTKIDSWAIGINIIDLISKFSLWPEFSQIYKQLSPKLIPILKKMCEVNPKKRIDCVQALNQLSPNSFIIRKYAKPWISKVGTGF